MSETLFETATETVTEAAMVAALIRRYGRPYGNGQRYALAAQVRSHAGFDALRTADFIAMDLWPSKGFELHGHEIKVSRSDWLRELKHPEKAAEFTPYMNRWWVVVPRLDIVRPGELPAAWGLMVLAGSRIQVARQAPKTSADPMPPTRIAALMRAVSCTAAVHARSR